LITNCSPAFYGIIKKKDVEKVNPDPYLATLMNCAFWVFYGMPFVHPNSTLVLSINSVGILFEVVYLTIFFIYATKSGRVSVHSFPSSYIIDWFTVIIVFMNSWNFADFISRYQIYVILLICFINVLFFSFYVQTIHWVIREYHFQW